MAPMSTPGNTTSASSANSSATSSLLWIPYVLIALVFVVFLGANFWCYHKKHRERYLRKRDEKRVKDGLHERRRITALMRSHFKSTAASKDGCDEDDDFHAVRSCTVHSFTKLGSGILGIDTDLSPHPVSSSYERQSPCVSWSSGEKLAPELTWPHDEKLPEKHSENQTLPTATNVSEIQPQSQSRTLAEKMSLRRSWFLSDRLPHTQSLTENLSDKQSSYQSWPPRVEWTPRTVPSHNSPISQSVIDKSFSCPLPFESLAFSDSPSVKMPYDKLPCDKSSVDLVPANTSSARQTSSTVYPWQIPADKFSYGQVPTDKSYPSHSPTFQKPQDTLSGKNVASDKVSPDQSPADKIFHSGNPSTAQTSLYNASLKEVPVHQLSPSQVSSESLSSPADGPSSGQVRSPSTQSPGEACGRRTTQTGPCRTNVADDDVVFHVKRDKSNGSAVR